jgi:thiamine-monophosphate kinase
MSPRISEIGEFSLIKLITSLDKSKNIPSMITYGDDASIIPLSYLCNSKTEGQGSIVVTCDSLVENKDFRVSYTMPSDLGWKLLAVNLSDLAAMGAVPKIAVVNIQLPSTLDVSWVSELYKGLYECAEHYEVRIVGGDTGAASEISLGLTAIGFIDNMPLLRSGAKEGDDVWLSGTIGEAGIALRILEGEETIKQDYNQDLLDRIFTKFFRPKPQLSLGNYLSQQKIASSAIDISDGLIQDMLHIAFASRVSFKIDFDALPSILHLKHKGYGLQSGEDFELLFTAPYEHRDILERSNFSVIRIGRVASGVNNENREITIKSSEYGVNDYRSFLKKLNLPVHGGFKHFS